MSIYVVLALGIVLALLLEWVLIRRMYDVPNRNIACFVVTLGLTQIMSGIFSMTCGRWSDQFTIPPLVSGITMIGPFPMPNNRILVLVVTFSVLAALFALLRFYLYGRALQAVFQNRESAALRGVNVRGIYRISFFLGSSLEAMRKIGLTVLLIEQNSRLTSAVAYRIYIMAAGNIRYHDTPKVLMLSSKVKNTQKSSFR